METIVKAKDQQAAEANKNASILLKELDLEKVLLNCDPRDLGSNVPSPKVRRTKANAAFILVLDSRGRRARNKPWLPSERSAKRNARRRRRSRRGSRRRRKGRKPRRTAQRCRRRRTIPLMVRARLTFRKDMEKFWLCFPQFCCSLFLPCEPRPLSEAEVPIEPPSATTTTTIGISATSTTFTTAFGKKRASVATTPSTNRKNKKNKTKDSPNEPIILQDSQVSSASSPAPLPRRHRRQSRPA